MLNDLNDLQISGVLPFSECLVAHFGQPSRKYSTRIHNETHECLAYPNFKFGKTAARVDLLIRVGTNWRKNIPEVIADADWLTAGLDWHIYPDRSLCWDVDARWQDRGELADRVFPLFYSYMHAAEWLKVSVCYLLDRNLFARRAGLEGLPKSCLQFKHGNDGKRQYAKERARFRYELENQLIAIKNTPRTTKIT